MTYLCNYCGIEHDLATRSVEHVVPERLLNSSLVLPDVCRFWNNVFARAFETLAVSSDFMREVLLKFKTVEERPRKIVYLGTVETARRTTEHRWLVNGEELLRDMPTRSSTDSITIDAFDDDGGRHPLVVHLPFHITTELTGDEYAIAEGRERLNREKLRIHDYFTRLAREPEQNEVLRKYLDEQGLHLREPKAVDLDEKKSPGSPGGAVADIIPKEYRFDRPLWTKFYMKIAWCFACLKLGRGPLVNVGGDRVLNYLRAEVLPIQLVDEVRALDREIAEALFRDASIDGNLVWLWRVSVAEGEDLIRSAPQPVTTRLSPILQQRSASERLAATWVHVTEPGTLDRAAGVPGPGHRNHRLHLRREMVGDHVVLVCDINLFGGTFAATAQLTPRLVPSQLAGVNEASEVITF